MFTAVYTFNLLGTETTSLRTSHAPEITHVCFLQIFLLEFLLFELDS